MIDFSHSLSYFSIVMSDRKIGYIVLLTLLVFLSTVTGYFVWLDIRPLHDAYIAFSEIAALEIEDPVLLNGSYSGYVHKTITRDEDVLVHIKTTQPLVLYEGYSISLKPKGVMGERFIQINPGPAGAPLVDADQILTGKFQLSPPEALAYVDKLREVITTFMKVSTDLYLGTPEQKSLVEMFSDFCNTLDSLSSKLVSAMLIFDRDLNKQMNEIAQLLKETSDVVYKITEKVPEIATSAENLVEKLDKLVIEVDKVVILADSVITPLNDSSSFIWKTNILSVQKHFATIRENIEEIRTEGLLLPVRPSGRKK